MAKLDNNKLKKTNKDFVLAQNALLSFRTDHQFVLAGDQFFLKFLPEGKEISSVMGMECLIDNIPFYLSFETLFFTDFLKAKFPELNITDVDQSLRGVILEAALAEAFNGFEGKTGKKVQIEGFYLKDKGQKTTRVHEKTYQYHFPFELHQGEGQKKIYGAIETGPAGLKIITDLCTFGDKTAFDPFQTTAKIPLFLGQTRLTTGDLEKLKKGDVVLTDTNFFRASTQRVFGLIPHQASFFGTVDNQILHITKIFERGTFMADEDDDFDLDDFMGDDFDDFDEEDEDDLELELSPEDEEILEHLDEEPLPEAEAAVEAQAPAEAPSEATPAAEEAPAEATMPAADTAPVKAETAKAEKPVDQVGELPIKMMFELSTLHMPYEKVKEITEGSQIDIGVDLNAPITVRANGKVIGKGQLIQIEKNIGVQMTELWKNAK